MNKNKGSKRGSWSKKVTCLPVIALGAVAGNTFAGNAAVTMSTVAIGNPQLAQPHQVSLAQFSDQIAGSEIVVVQAESEFGFVPITHQVTKLVAAIGNTKLTQAFEAEIDLVSNRLLEAESEVVITGQVNSTPGLTPPTASLTAPIEPAPITVQAVDFVAAVGNQQLDLTFESHIDQASNWLLRAKDEVLIQGQTETAIVPITEQAVDFAAGLGSSQLTQSLETQVQYSSDRLIGSESDVVTQALNEYSLRPITTRAVLLAASGGQASDAEHGDDSHGKTAKGDDHGDGHGGKHIPRLSSVPIPLKTDYGKRAAPLIELGGDFLGTGNIRRGYVMPGGAVWTPRFWAYGTGRSAYQRFERPGDPGETTEWVNRLDLFGNLQLTGTERVLLGISPLHRENRFSGYTFSPDEEDGSFDEFNADIRTLFFEGDLAELLPGWDKEDSKKNDIGFTIGRQQVLFQDGMTINDTLDSFGLSKNNIRFEGVPWLVSWRSSFLYAWNEVNRENNQEDDTAELYAWFNQWDTLKSTIDLDLIYVDSDQNDSDQFVASVNFIQRLGKIGSTFRIAHSAALDEESAVAGDGTLLFAEFNYVPAYTHDNLYLNMFAAIDNYTSASRDPLAGGPLGRVGLLYAASGIGSYPAPLNNRANDAVGFSAGYQKIDDKNRRQLTFEVGARESDNDNLLQYGVAARFQQALGKRFVFQADGFIADQEDRDSSYGFRLELLLKL